VDEEAKVRMAILEIVGDVVRVPEADLLAQPILGAHGWDSLAALEVLAQLESRFSVSLDLREYNAARQIDDLVALVVGAGTSQRMTTA
jgi:acyl carrier protein